MAEPTGKDQPTYAKGGYITGPDGNDAVPFIPFEREAIIDRHGNVICRYIHGRWIPAGASATRKQGPSSA
jgi:hypothetical protein